MNFIIIGIIIVIIAVVLRFAFKVASCMMKGALYLGLAILIFGLIRFLLM